MTWNKHLLLVNYAWQTLEKQNSLQPAPTTGMEPIIIKQNTYNTRHIDGSNSN